MADELLQGAADRGAMCAFFRAMGSGQFEDMDGAGMRILIDEEEK